MQCISLNQLVLHDSISNIFASRKPFVVCGIRERNNDRRARVLWNAHNAIAGGAYRGLREGVECR